MENILLDVGGKELYFDIDALALAVQVEEEHLFSVGDKGDINFNDPVGLPDNNQQGIKIDVTKYENV